MLRCCPCDGNWIILDPEPGIEAKMQHSAII